MGNFFRHLKPDMPIPDDVNLEEARQQLGDDSDEEDEEEMLGLLMENDCEIGCSVRDQLIPFAVRWFTGEACPEEFDDDDDFDEDDEEEDSDDDYDDDDDDDEPLPKRKPQPKNKKGGSGGGGGDD